MATTEWDFTKAFAGPVLGPIMRAIVVALDDGWPHERLDLRDRIGADPGTFNSAVSDLAREGIITKRGIKNREIQLTTLGRRWATDHGILPTRPAHPAGMAT